MEPKVATRGRSRWGPWSPTTWVHRAGTIKRIRDLGGTEDACAKYLGVARPTFREWFHTAKHIEWIPKNLAPKLAAYIANLESASLNEADAAGAGVAEPRPVAERGAAEARELAATLAADRVGSRRADDLDRLIADVRAGLPEFTRQVNSQRLVSKFNIHLEGLDETLGDPDRVQSASEELAGLEELWREIEHIERAAAVFRSGLFGELNRRLGELLPRLRELTIDAAHSVPNDWDENENLPHSRDVPELLRLINERLIALKSARHLSADKRNAADKELRRLRRVLTVPRLSLVELDDARQQLEKLDRNLFRELIVAAQIVLGRYAARLPNLAIFREAAFAPEMVVLPAGEFWMGSAVGEEDALESEIVPNQGKRRMRIPRRFAMGRYPVTFEEYDIFQKETGRRRPRDFDWDRGRRPVIDVDWDDAIAYVAWLNERLGVAAYGLPSEARWEYACRAGTSTRRWWGDVWDPGRANGNRSFESGRTSPVDHYDPNPWKLHDMIGNVWEWCADEWSQNIELLPDDGIPFEHMSKNKRKMQNKAVRVLRGGSWFINPRNLRSASRDWYEPDNRNDDLGFRVSRTL